MADVLMAHWKAPGNQSCIIINLPFALFPFGRGKFYGLQGTFRTFSGQPTMREDK